MDRNKKRAFGLIGAFFAWGVYTGIKAHILRINNMEAKLDLVDKTQDRLLQVLDDAYQPAFDEQFEEIIEHFND